MKFIIGLFAILFTFVSFGNSQYTEVHCKHFIFGIPRGAPPSSDLIIRDCYVLSSNDDTKFADWVAYRVDRFTIVGGETSRNWKADPYLEDEETLEPEDYRGAHAALHTDRGHQAPLASLKGCPDWESTNYLSNITPQKSDLNQGPWRALEEAERDLAELYGIAFVLTGPLYERDMGTMPEADEPCVIPSGYWKIIVSGESDNMQIYAFIFDQNTDRRANFKDFNCSVDEIERRSGYDFFGDLDDSLEDAVEASDNQKAVEEM